MGAIPDLDDDGALYNDDPRTEVAAMTPAGTRVLDVGCSRGAFGAELKRRDPSRTVFGIEPTAAAVEARLRLDDATQGFFPTDLPEGWDSFDVICFNDVLEHMVDPWTTLRECRELLAPGGCVIASIPNVRYIDVVIDLLWHGQWRYQPTGVLDQTHLRFFTKQSIAEMFVHAGYDVESLTATHLTESGHPIALCLRGTRLTRRFTNILAQRYIAIGRVS